LSTPASQQPTQASAFSFMACMSWAVCEHNGVQ
jgi:hypothetical protein